MRWPDPAAWQEPQNDPTVAANVARLDAQIQAGKGSREPFTLGLPRSWHTEIYAGCTFIPARHAHYVGNFRGTPGRWLRDYPVEFGADSRGQRFLGAPSDQVAGDLAAFETSLQAALDRLDANMPIAAEATSSRLNLLLDEVAKHYAEWLRIHPFPDGNGRTARILANWMCSRYWQPLIFPGRPPVDRDDLITATTPALTPPNPDYRPLVRLMRNRLGRARVAAMRAATGPSGGAPAGP